MIPALLVEGLAHRWPGSGVRALAGVSFAVAAGSVYALLGPNGAGKTTTASVISGLLKPDSGRFFVCGIDAFERPAKVKGLIGLAPQETALYETLSARENCRFFGSMAGLSRARLKDRIAYALDFAELSDRADRLVREYSGGMKRRLNLVIALLHEPKLLLLDEPTVGVDAQSRACILDGLAALKKSGTAMVYTTHYLEEAEKIADVVGIVEAGKLVAEGPPAELIQKIPGAKDLGEVYFALTGKALRDQ